MISTLHKPDKSLVHKQDSELKDFHFWLWLKELMHIWALVASRHPMEVEANIASFGAGKCNPDEGNSRG